MNEQMLLLDRQLQSQGHDIARGSSLQYQLMQE